MYGFSGKLTGRKGDAVFRVRKGVQVVAQYNPIVANPSTSKQVQNRAKLKLISQLSAILGPVIAIPSQGGATTRNLFTKANYPLAVAEGTKASIPMARVQITDSHVGMIAFSVDRTDGQHLNAHLVEDGTQDFDRVVYVAVALQPDNSYRLLGQAMSEAGGVNGTFPVILPYTANEVTVLAYGIRDNVDRVKSSFLNIEGSPAAGVAQLLTSRQVSLGDITMSETTGVTLSVGQASGTSTQDDRATITLTTQGDGTATGGGSYAVGTAVTLTATPASGATFSGYYEGGALVSANQSYTFTASGNRSIVAVFASASQVTLRLTTNDATLGNVSGGGAFNPGASVTAHATPTASGRFVGWYENETQVSTNADYSFVINADRALEARFEAAGGGGEVTITASANDDSRGTVTGSGSYAVGQQVTLVATATGLNTFSGWHLGSAAGTLVSSQATYTFAASTNQTYVAVFTSDED